MRPPDSPRQGRGSGDQLEIAGAGADPDDGADGVAEGARGETSAWKRRALAGLLLAQLGAATLVATMVVTPVGLGGALAAFGHPVLLPLLGLKPLLTRFGLAHRLPELAVALRYLIAGSLVMPGTRPSSSCASRPRGSS